MTLIAYNTVPMPSFMYGMICCEFVAIPALVPFWRRPEDEEMVEGEVGLMPESVMRGKSVVAQYKQARTPGFSRPSKVAQFQGDKRRPSRPVQGTPPGSPGNR